uniref:RNA-dependent RNA polymerase n=1 Tax=Toxocara canis TaxID=6265 RepID=A0A183U3D2_TOXCA
LYTQPTERIFIGRKFRAIWNRVKELHVSRTRGWIPEEDVNNDKQSRRKDAIRTIKAYIEEYDYKEQCDELSGDMFMKKMLWTSASASEAYILSATPTITFYTEMMQCLESDHGIYLAVNMATLREAEKRVPSSTNNDMRHKVSENDIKYR